MHVYLYLISANYVSTKRFAALSRRLEELAPKPAMAIRLEADGVGLWQALDTLRARGARRIDLRPVGLPFSQSLENWLPGAAGAWCAQQSGVPPEVFFASSPEHDDDVIRAVASAEVSLQRVVDRPRGEIGKGWDLPPSHQHHLLVCTGPRCHLKDAPNLADHLKSEIRRAGLGDSCLVTTTGCVFPCNAGPVIVHYPRGDWYRVADLSEIQRFVKTVLVQGGRLEHLIFHQTGVSHETA
ncbi:(2Fe-2S) ferredoxin domain-containing protein [Tritonibacter mobilis]|uniref:(2Fe-2S) ferredoxin domain-containing protein n=1 Tax=Tritonibacter mobilis TaxID=379347 RepID=UPI003381E3CE|nr:(2Fe-2S) ferredoxin domain-containing protein [Tritonibacter mobilis]